MKSNLREFPGILWASLVIGAWLAAVVGVVAADGPVAKPKAAVPATTWTTNWTSLFDGASLTHWAVTDFGGQGAVAAEGGEIKIGAGAELSGITWTNGPLPKTNYEVELEAKRVEGGDFFCGLTFPVADSSCSLILGGWGGSVTGLSSLDGNDASENETSKTMTFAANRWYRVKVRVLPHKIVAWVDDEKIVDVDTKDRRVALRPGPIFMSAPLGVATYQTASALRNFKLRLIEH